MNWLGSNPIGVIPVQVIKTPHSRKFKMTEIRSHHCKVNGGKTETKLKPSYTFNKQPVSLQSWVFSSHLESFDNVTLNTFQFRNVKFYIRMLRDGYGWKNWIGCLNETTETGEVNSPTFPRRWQLMIIRCEVSDSKSPELTIVTATTHYHRVELPAVDESDFGPRDPVYTN